jgi:hypothetical protein
MMAARVFDPMSTLSKREFEPLAEGKPLCKSHGPDDLVATTGGA